MPRLKVNHPFAGIVTFCKSPICEDLENLSAEIAVLGVPWDEGVGYRPGCRFGPRAIREASTRYGFSEQGIAKPGYWDIHSGTRRLTRERIVDCGDADVLFMDWRQTADNIRLGVEQIVGRHAFPVVLGGSCSIKFPAVAACAGFPGLDVVHVDAHLDFNDEVFGTRFAGGNALRQIAELPFVNRLIHVGLRGLRSREDPYHASKARGNLAFSAEQVRTLGVPAILERLPRIEHCFLTIDADALDPSIAPGVGSPEPAGLLYQEARDFVAGLAKRTRIIGLDVTEVNPMVDPTGITAVMVTNLILEALGAIFEPRHAMG